MLPKCFSQIGMVRNYRGKFQKGVKRGPNQKISQETLRQALDDIQLRRRSLRGAAEFYQIPKSTLSDHLTGKSLSTRKGPEPHLGKEFEDRLDAWLTKMARCGYGQGKEQLFNRIQQVLKRLGTPNPFRDDRPTEMWYCLFMGRYPHLSRRMPSLLGGASNEDLYERC